MLPGLESVAIEENGFFISTTIEEDQEEVLKKWQRIVRPDPAVNVFTKSLVKLLRLLLRLSPLSLEGSRRHSHSNGLQVGKEDKRMVDLFNINLVKMNHCVK